MLAPVPISQLEMRRWPPLLWLPVFVGSLFVLLGATGPDALLVAGAGLIAIAFITAIALAVRPSPDGPRPRGAIWALAGVGAFYVIGAVVAGASLGIEYGLVALAAGAVPATAVAIMIAAMRVKTEGDGDRLDDATATDGDDTLPSIGADSKTPLGDTNELSDVNDEVRT
jgi:hypothetical protein